LSTLRFTASARHSQRPRDYHPCRLPLGRPRCIANDRFVLEFARSVAIRCHQLADRRLALLFVRSLCCRLAATQGDQLAGGRRASDNDNSGAFHVSTPNVRVVSACAISIFPDFNKVPSGCAAAKKVRPSCPSLPGVARALYAGWVAGTGGRSRSAGFHGGGIDISLRWRRLGEIHGP
jgi:hypothetical protein